MHKSRTVAISEITDIFVPIIRLIYAHNEGTIMRVLLTQIFLVSLINP